MSKKSPKKILWFTLALLILVGGAIAYCITVYLPAQTSPEPQGRFSSVSLISTEPLVQPSSETSILTNTLEPSPTNPPTLTGTPEMVLTASFSLKGTIMANSEDNAAQAAPLFVLTGHSDDVTEVAFSPDNSLVASSSADGTIRLWNVSDGSLLHVLEGHTDHVLCLAFSPDGTLLASGSNDFTIRIWQVNDGALVRKISSYSLGRVLDVEFSPDGSLLAVADHLCYVQLRRVNSGILYRTLVQPNCVASQGGTVQAWGLAFSPDGEQIITGEGRPCCGGSLHLWQVDDEYTPPQLLKGYNLQIRDLAYAPNGSKIAVALLGSPVFWLVEAESGNVFQTFEGHTYRVNSVTFSPDGELLASGSRDQKVRLWRVKDGELIHTLVGHTDEVNSVAFSPDGSLIASGSKDDTVIIWGIDDT
ncbi:MAG: WD40 repeat domain-containing protein [Anaerolineales bacterium]|nr:MAG: WD40 repeat domain-containing protein [Anaerolineales bacterium]